MASYKQLMSLQLCVHRCAFMVCIKYEVTGTNMTYIEIPDLLLWPKGGRNFLLTSASLLHHRGRALLRLYCHLLLIAITALDPL